VAWLGLLERCPDRLWSELYVPWRLNEGDVLYRDIAYFNGPLSPYWNSILFRIGGASLQTLTVGNGILTAAFAWLIHRRVEAAGGPIAAGAGLILFFSIFACGHFPGVGNYKFLAPYSHELTHGLFLGLLAFSAALRGGRGRGAAWAAITGILTGLVFLTKAEVFVGTAGAIAWFYALRWKAERDDTWRRLGLFVLGAFIPPIIACGMLWIAMPFADALKGALGSWVAILTNDAPQMPFYRMYMGLDRAGYNLGVMLKGLGFLCLLLIPPFILDRLTAHRSMSMRIASGGGVAIVATLVIV
jgi:hypothetical protein